MLRSTALHLKHLSDGKFDVTWDVKLMVEKWGSAASMARLVHGFDVKIFRKAADFSVLRQNNGAARLQGATKKAHWAIVEDVDIIIGGFYCGNYSPLNNSRIQGTVDIEGSMSKSGRTWSHMIDYLLYCDSVKRLVVENAKDVCADPNHLGAAVDVMMSQLTELGFSARYTILAAAVAGHDPHKRVRFYMSGLRGLDASGLGAVLQEALPSEQFVHPVAHYLYSAEEAQADIWLSHEKLTEFRDPSGDTAGKGLEDGRARDFFSQVWLW